VRMTALRACISYCTAKCRSVVNLTIYCGIITALYYNSSRNYSELILVHKSYFLTFGSSALVVNIQSVELITKLCLTSVVVYVELDVSDTVFWQLLHSFLYPVSLIILFLKKKLL